MENIRKLLDAAKAATGAESDYRLAKNLGLPDQRISDYYKGERFPDEFACLKIAEAIDMPLAQVIATVKAEAEKDEKRRMEWRNYLKKVGGIAATVAALLFAPVILNMSPLAGNAQAATVSGDHDLYYVKSLRRLKEIIATARDRLYIAFRRVFCQVRLNGGITA